MLLFSGDALVVFLFQEDVEAFPYYKVLYYLCYKSRADCNIHSPPMGTEFPNNIQPSNEVTFTMKKLRAVESEEAIFGKTHKMVHFESEPLLFELAEEHLQQLEKKGTLPKSK